MGQGENKRKQRRRLRGTCVGHIRSQCASCNKADTEKREDVGGCWGLESELELGRRDEERGGQMAGEQA